MPLKAIIRTLTKERNALLKQLEPIELALKDLTGKRGKSTGEAMKPRHKMSAKARKAIGRAQKLRWQKVRAEKKTEK